MKDKAIEMVSEFIGHSYGNNNEMELYHAKCCAIICVDYIIKSAPSKPTEYSSTLGYWTELKDVILALTYNEIEQK